MNYKRFRKVGKFIVGFELIVTHEICLKNAEKSIEKRKKSNAKRKKIKY